MVQIGFIDFTTEIFEQLIYLSAQNGITDEELREGILQITQFTNKLFNLPIDSENYIVNAIHYEAFYDLYQSIHHEFTAAKIPMFQVAGAINLKDPEVPGYVAFSLPTSFVKGLKNGFTLKEFLINAAHERFERFLLKETLIAEIYEKAREDYHSTFTLDKRKNAAAFLLYELNKQLIPIQETMTYAVSHLVDDYIEAHYDKFSQIALPLVEKDFTELERQATDNFIRFQFEKAHINNAAPLLLQKRLKAGLKVLKFVTSKFQSLLNDFLTLYPSVRAKLKAHTTDLTIFISETIQLALQKNGLSDILSLFEQENANL